MTTFLKIQYCVVSFKMKGFCQKRVGILSVCLEIVNFDVSIEAMHDKDRNH